MSILTVPHVKQEGRTHCGAACLEMVYRYFGVSNVTQNDIWKERNTTRPDGTAPFMTTNEMVNDLIEKGFQLVVGQLYLDAKQCTESLQGLLDEEIPIITCKQWNPNPIYGHFVVIIGIEEDNIIYLDPEQESTPQKKSIKIFLKEWESTGKEVVGGEFIAMGKDEKKLRFKKLQLIEFSAPTSRSFSLDSIDFPK